jgi:hypothetical protein
MNSRLNFTSIKEPFSIKEFVAKVASSQSTKKFFLIFLLMWYLINLIFAINCYNEYILDIGGFFILPVITIITAIIIRANHLKKILRKTGLHILIFSSIFCLLHFITKLFFPSSYLNQFINPLSTIKIFSMDLNITSDPLLLGQIGEHLSFFKITYTLSFYIIVSHLHIKRYIAIEQRGLIKKELTKAVRVISLTFLLIMPVSAIIFMLLIPKNFIANLFFSSIFRGGLGLGFFFSVVFLSELEVLLEIENGV